MSDYVYLIKGHDIAEGLYKVGVSTDVDARLRQMSGYPFDVSLMVKFPVRAMAIIEDRLHERLATWRKRGEWFYLPDPIIKMFLSAKDADNLLQLLGIESKNTYACGDAAIVDEHVSRNIFSKVLQLEGLNRKRYKRSDIIADTNLSPTLVTDTLRGKNVAYTHAELNHLLTFFAREGMPVTIGDLFVVTDDTG